MNSVAIIKIEDSAPNTWPSMSADLKSRPFQYIVDLINSPPLRFSIGNFALAVSLGTAVGIHTGAIGAGIIQFGITTYTAQHQLRSTYKGEDFGAPFRSQSVANFATSVVLLTAGIAGGPHKLAATILPAFIFALWGKGHIDAARYMDRLMALKNKNKSEIEIHKDVLLRKFEKKYMIEFGVSDMTAPFSSKPLDQIAVTLHAAITHISLLSTAQWASLVPLPFFATGLCKAFGLKLSVIKNSNNAYAAGYSAGAIVTAMSGNIPFAAAQALWALGYRSLAASGERKKPISAMEWKMIIPKKPRPPVLSLKSIS